MDRPTEKQIREFWGWCGFKEILSKTEQWRFAEFKTTNHWWEAPSGRRYKDAPPIDLNNLFKYAVPKAHTILGDKEFFKLLVRWCMEVITEGDDALALFWALWQVKTGNEA